MSAAPGTSWPTLAAFHAEDPARAVSREVVFGSEWYGRRDDPPWRVSWLMATGEFVVVRLVGEREADHGRVELLGITDLPRCELHLRGWPAVCGLAGSLPWLRARLAELTQP